MSWLSTRIDKVPGGEPAPYDEAHRGATGRPAGHAWWRGLALGRRRIAGVGLHHQEADGRERAGTTGMQKAEVADVHKAIGQDVLQASAAALHDVALGRTWARTAPLPRGTSDRTVIERDEAAVGDGDCEDRGGQVGAGGVSRVLGLPENVPGEDPALGGAVVQQAGVAHLVFAQSAGDGREGFDRAKEVRSGG
jgi:hypothetical protein